MNRKTEVDPNELNAMKQNIMKALGKKRMAHSTLVRRVLGEDRCGICHRLFHTALNALEAEGRI